MIKRLFDLVVASIGLIIFSPVLIAITALVKLDSPGPALYRGVRTGRYGRPFHIFKFRTMVVNAEQLGGGSTGKDDPRVTRLGRVLRRHKLDELPQLINVLLGDMSIVGPRPELPMYTKLYSRDEQLILSVRPGITDYASLEFINLAEILGRVQPDTVYEEQVRPVKNALRMKYVQEQTLRGDLVIIGRTLFRLIHTPSAASFSHEPQSRSSDAGLPRSHE